MSDVGGEDDWARVVETSAHRDPGRNFVARASVAAFVVKDLRLIMEEPLIAAYIRVVRKFTGTMVVEQELKLRAFPQG